jgi:lipid-A-disaccharide synthase-like uncharacterized protein
MEHIIGFIGTVLVLLAYLLLSTKKIQSDSVSYQGLNLVGAILLIIYAVVLTAWANVLLNVVWGFIAIFALAKLFVALRRKKDPPVNTPLE